VRNNKVQAEDHADDQARRASHRSGDDASCAGKALSEGNVMKKFRVLGMPDMALIGAFAHAHPHAPAMPSQQVRPKPKQRRSIVPNLGPFPAGRAPSLAQ
jgi:hypothetical protein